MGIVTRKQPKIQLVKGQKLCLTKTTKKTGEVIDYAFIGANWSCLRNGASVDLDSSLLLFDENKRLIDKVYYGKTMSNDGSVRHSGDDRCGDTNGGDELDNEVIRISLSRIDPRVKYMVSILNNYTQQKFGDIPNIELRIYTNETGRHTDIEEVLASYKLDNNPEYSKAKAIILGHFYQHSGVWKFSADGLGTTESSISDIASGSALSVI